MTETLLTILAFLVKFDNSDVIVLVSLAVVALSLLVVLRALGHRAP